MARRAALALARTPAARPALGVPRTRALVIAGAVVLAAGLAYLGARGSSVFALQKIEVKGATPEVAKQVRAALAPLRGESLVSLDRGDVEADLRALPWVASAHVDRAFPHRLVVSVEPERPVAVYRDGAHAWIVAASGKVIATVRPDERPRLARLRVELARPPAVGQTLSGEGASTALRLVSGFPRRFPGRVLYARIDETGATLVLTQGPELRLGDTTGLEAKFAAARAILAALPDYELTSTGYVDVSVPERVVVGSNTQPESEGLDSRS
jgi:cell division septal protein FtsQ